MRELVGDGDRALVVEELTVEHYAGPDDDGYDIGAARRRRPRRLPFLTDRRVVVARHAGVFGTKDAVAPLVAYLADPLPRPRWCSSGSGIPARSASRSCPTCPRALADAVSGAGGVVVDTKPGTGKAQAGWIDEQLAGSGLRLDAAAPKPSPSTSAASRAASRGCWPRSIGVFGDGAQSHPGGGRAVPRRGRRRRAVGSHRRHRRGRRAPARSPCCAACSTAAAATRCRSWRCSPTTTCGCCASTARASGSEKAAAEVLGHQGQHLPRQEGARRGPGGWARDRLAEMTALLAQADLDLHGARAWPPELVVEVLVARLAGRSRSAALAGRRSARPGPARTRHDRGRGPGRGCGPRRRGSVGGGLRGGDPLHEAALAPGGLVLVDHALAGGLVDAA